MPRSSLRLLLALALASSAALASTMPPDAVFQGFVPNGDYALQWKGQIVDEAELFFSDKAACFLVLAPQLATPIVVSPREKAVLGVPAASVARRDDGTVDLLADATFERLAGFRVEGEAVHFDLAGIPAAVVARPYLLGLQDGAAVFAYKPEYGRGAAAYAPDPAALRKLAAVPAKPTVIVRSYFGSWCPHCTHLLPRLLKVEKELGGQGVRFEYYGLPLPFDDEPEAERLGIRGVPTAIVLRDGKEIGRLVGGGWEAPEASLATLLAPD